jgi:hypothetical protein
MDVISNPFLEAALRYAELGYPVFPCAPGTKKPITPNGFHDATTNQEQIERWWAQQPRANVAIRTSGLIVIDIDGGTNDWLASEPEKKLELASSPTATTPRSGHHHVFRQPAGKCWRCTEGQLAPKVDTRGEGGYFVVPPSIRRDGKAYLWIKGIELDEPPERLPEPPAWLAEQLDRVAAGRPQEAHGSPGLAHVAASVGESNQIPTGQRNATLARLAGAMRRVGMSKAEISAALNQVNRDRCVPPISTVEVGRIVESVVRYPPDEVSVALVEDHWRQMYAAPAAASDVADPGSMPESLLRVPGLVSHVMDYCLETAPYPNVVMAFCGALALQAFLAGRKVRDQADNRSNIYLLGLAHSAAGKDHPRKINTRILHHIGMGSGLGDRFASGEGIQDALFVSPSMLFQTDEIDGMLLSINKAKDARYESVMGTLLSMYSASNSVFPMRRKAGKEHPGAIDQPCLVIFGTAIPNHYYEALSERMLTNGFFARSLTLESGPRSAGQEPRILELPTGILETARWWADFHPGSGNLDAWHPVPAIVEYADEAQRLVANARAEAEAEYARAEERGDAVGTTVWGRVNEQSRKLAMIYAVSENHQSPKIGADAVRWATQFVMHQTRRMLFMAQSHAAANPFHSDCLRLLRKLREAPDQTMPHSTLLKRMKVDAQAFQHIIQTLSQQGDIESIAIKTTGRTGVSYRLTGG